MISETHPVIFVTSIIFLYVLIGLISGFIDLAITYIKEGKNYRSVESFVECNLDMFVGFIFAWPILIVFGICIGIPSIITPAMLRSFLLLFGDKTKYYTDPYSEDDWRD